MNIRQLLTDVALTFVVTLVTAVVVTFLWNYFRHGVSMVDWETAFLFAIIFAIALPLTRALEKKSNGI